MRKLMIFALCASALCSHYASADEITDAEAFGAMLTAAIQQGSDIDWNKRSESKAIKKWLKEHQCPGLKYQGYIVGDEKQYFYLIGRKGNEVIVGRHFKAPIVDSAIDIDAFDSSTKGCLSLGAKKADVAAMFTTHLQPYPNEFHVAQSSLHAVTLYISTKSGLFVVKNGEITLSDG